MLQLSLGTTKLSVYICLSWLGIIPFGFRSEFNLNEIPDTNHITGFVDSSFDTDFNGSTGNAHERRLHFRTEQVDFLNIISWPNRCRTVDRDGHGRSGTPGRQI